MYVLKKAHFTLKERICVQILREYIIVSNPKSPNINRKTNVKNT